MRKTENNFSSNRMELGAFKSSFSVDKHKNTSNTRLMSLNKSTSLRENNDINNKNFVKFDKFEISKNEEKTKIQNFNNKKNIFENNKTDNKNEINPISINNTENNKNIEGSNKIDTDSNHNYFNGYKLTQTNSFNYLQGNIKKLSNREIELKLEEYKGKLNIYLLKMLKEEKSKEEERELL